MPEPRELTIHEAARLLRDGRLTAEALTASCLERIHRHEERIRAWVEIYPEDALENARRCDRTLRRGKWLGDLHGIPIGIKDIIDVKGMWTRAGCAAYPARRAEKDAPAVGRLRRAGAVFLGKTETTAFANNDPAVTRNPWNLDHTPGGSSSGSAAAVADRMCLAALGTQTGGSVLRPAAYNGIVGFKPTYGAISLEGVVPVAWSLDHMGAHARCVADAFLLCRLMRTPRTPAFAGVPPGTGGRFADLDRRPPRLGGFPDILTGVSPEVVDHLAAVRERLLDAGATWVDLDLPTGFTGVTAAHRTLFDAELAVYHHSRYQTHCEHYPPKLKRRIAEGMTVPAKTYIEALGHRVAFQSALSATSKSVDALIMPATPTTAPPGLASTGSPLLNSPWSFAGFPAVSLPSGLDARGLPFGLQIVGKANAERALAIVAGWCETQLCFDAYPATAA